MEEKLTPEQKALAGQLFDEWFAHEYPGPRTIISDPHWHAPRIFAAALSCIKEVLAIKHG